MQIVIDVPDEMYDWFDNGFPDEDDAKKLWQIVKNSTPLPKGHGRLIDADALNFNADYYEPLISKRDFDFAPTIIEAERSEKE